MIKHKYITGAVGFISSDPAVMLLAAICPMNELRTLIKIVSKLENIKMQKQE